MNILNCIQAEICTRAHKLFHCASIITETSRTPNAQSCTVCHCNHLYLDYNRRPSKRYAAESCSLHIISSYSSFEPPFSLYFTQRDEKQLGAPKQCVIVLYRLMKCGVTDEGCAALASALRSNSSHLRELNLSGNKIGDLGVKRLCAVLKNPDCKLEILW